MSSTGRKEDRVEGDVYPTPRWCVRRLLEACSDLPTGLWAEPCVGEGAIVQAVREARGDVCRWVTQDLRIVPAPHNSVAHYGGDFLGAPGDMFRDEDVRVLLTNPPFSLARSFIERSEELMPRAWRIFLLRLNFLGSDDRHAWLSRNMPISIYQLPNRPSFVRGKTDSIEYGWFVWPPDNEPRWNAQISLLGLTSLEERKRG